MHSKYLPLFNTKPKALYGTTGGTYSARVFRPVIREWTFELGFVLLSSGLSIKVAEHSFQVPMPNSP